jgi:hypothetical protein
MDSWSGKFKHSHIKRIIATLRKRMTDHPAEGTQYITEPLETLKTLQKLLPQKEMRPSMDDMSL